MARRIRRTNRRSNIRKVRKNTMKRKSMKRNSMKRKSMKRNSMKRKSMKRKSMKRINTKRRTWLSMGGGLGGATPVLTVAQPVQTVLINAVADARGLEQLQARACPPVEQRAIFVGEVAGGDAVVQLKEAVAKASGGVTVVSANCYYGRCVATTDGREEAVDPARTMAAIQALLQAGADVVCMQEICGPPAPEGQGKDDYGEFSKQFPQAAFAPWPEELEKLGATAGVKMIFAPAKNSTMYRLSFGNAIAINTATLNVDEGSVRMQDCLTEPTEEEGHEGRSAVTVVVEPVGGGGKLAVCCTHLTEKVIGKSGKKQCEQLEALLAGTLALPVYAGLPTILCGDFNVNNSREMPRLCAAFCNSSGFLHCHPEFDPYARLADAGFKGGQSYAQEEGSVLATCWNAACVDYNGSRGAVKTLAVGVIDPTHNGFVIADHKWTIGIYKHNI